MKNRCAILTAFDPYAFKGGIEIYTQQLVNLLQTHGVMVDAYHLDRLPGPAEEPASATPWRSPFLHKLHRLGRAFYWVDHQYDFVISHAFFGFGYSPPRIPAYTIFHSTHAQYAEDNRELFSQDWYLEVRSLFGFGAERLSTIGKKVIAVSESVADEARTHYAARGVHTAPTGVDRSVFFPRANRRELRDKYAIPQDAFVGVFLARWDLDKAIDVLEQVVAKTPDIFWLLVLGSGASCPLTNPTLRIVQNIDREEVAERLSLADFLFHPARYEGFGLAMVEALACGLPVIAAPVGVMRTVGQDPLCRSLLLPPYSGGKERVIAAAIRAIDRLRQDNRLRDTLRQAGPALVQERFDHHQWEMQMLLALDIAVE
jgi:glycosyltransferase involved in cell wall biosynthesis